MSARNDCSAPRERSISSAVPLDARPISATSAGPAALTRGLALPRANARAPRGGRDEEPCIGGVRLLGKRVDDLARLLSRADPGLDRGQERRRELLEVQARLIVLIPQQQSRDSHAGRDSSDEHHREVREEEPRRDALGHAQAGATSLYPTPPTA